MVPGRRLCLRSCHKLVVPILLALGVLAPWPAAAQAVYGSISGTVTD